MQVVRHENAVSILEYFDDLEDPRCSINRQHLLGDLIVISVCGVLAGADGREGDWRLGSGARQTGRALRVICRRRVGLRSFEF